MNSGRDLFIQYPLHVYARIHCRRNRRDIRDRRGAIIAPFCVRSSIFLSTLLQAPRSWARLLPLSRGLFLQIIPSKNGLATAPDLLLGFLFGIGGFAGMYLGASLQTVHPQKFIKVMLGLVIVYVSITCIVQFFSGYF